MRSDRKFNGRQSVGLVFARVHRGASLSVWPSIADECERRDVNLFCFPGGQVGSADPYETSRNAVFDLAAAAPLDGVLIWPAALYGTKPESEIERFVSCYDDLPAVGISAGVEGIPSVAVDFYSGMRAAVEHMIDAHSYRPVAFIRGPEKHPSAEDRYRAYLDVLSERGLNADPKLISSPRDWDCGSEAVRELLDERRLVPGRDFRAIAVASDLLALRAMIELQERGCRIPEDVAVIGMNDIQESSVASPPLTTVNAPFRDLGAISVRTLLELMNGAEVPRSRLLPSRLVVRRSCGCSSSRLISAVPDAEDCGNDPEAPAREIGKLVGFSPEACEERIKPMVGRWLRAAENGDFEPFLDSMEALIDFVVRGRLETAPWQHALTLLRRSLPKDMALDGRIVAEEAVGRARMLLAESAERTVNFRVWEDDRRTEKLRKLNHALQSALDMPKLALILQPALTELGIRSAYVCRYAEDDFGTAQLIFGFRDGETVSDPSLFFPAADLAPRGKLPDRRLAYIVEPLYFQNSAIGFALLEIGPRAGALYEELKDSISNALRTVILFSRFETARASAERSNQIKTRLLSNVSHELRAPVTQILQSAARLAARTDESDADLRCIRVNAEHQRRLVGDLLDISRAEIDELDIQRELVDIEPIAREVFSGFAASAAEGVQWKLEIPERLPFIPADRIRFRQILFNLLGNAAKFTVSGSVALRMEVTPPKIRIRVSDTGPGIAASRLASVFEPFISSGERGEGPGGVGLGLSITRHLVSLHFGSIRVESRVGEGASFTVELPLPPLEGSTPAAPGPENGCILLLSAASNVAPDVEAAAARNSLAVRRVALEDAERGGLDAVVPAAIAWDLSAATVAEWRLFRKIRQHPNFASAPFMLFGAGRIAEGITGAAGFLAKDAAEESLARTIMLCCPIEGDAPILIADDEPEEAERLRQAVGKAFPGIDVAVASDGAQAWEAIRARPPRMAVLDVLMPGLSGFDLVDRMRSDERFAAIPVLLLTNKVITAEDVDRLNGYARVVFRNKGVRSDGDLAEEISRTLYGSDPRLPQPTSVIVKRVIAYLNGNYRSNITRWKLAESANVSEYYLSRIFRAELGITVWDYLTRLRVHRAKELLQSGTDAIAAVGEKVGFPDQAYFSRVFRKATGMSPIAYRDSVRSAAP